jgi:hypothetical protein
MTDPFGTPVQAGIGTGTQPGTAGLPKLNPTGNAGGNTPDAGAGVLGWLYSIANRIGATGGNSLNALLALIHTDTSALVVPAANTANRLIDSALVTAAERLKNIDANTAALHADLATTLHADLATTLHADIVTTLLKALAPTSKTSVAVGTTTVFSGAGRVFGVYYANGTFSGTVTAYDALSATGTPIFVFTFGATAATQQPFLCNLLCSTGLTVVTTNSTLEVTWS